MIVGNFWSKFLGNPMIKSIPFDVMQISSNEFLKSVFQLLSGTLSIFFKGVFTAWVGYGLYAWLLALKSLINSICENNSVFVVTHNIIESVSCHLFQMHSYFQLHTLSSNTIILPCLSDVKTFYLLHKLNK